MPGLGQGHEARRPGAQGEVLGCSVPRTGAGDVGVQDAPHVGVGLDRGDIVTAPIVGSPHALAGLPRESIVQQSVIAM